MRMLTNRLLLAGSAMAVAVGLLCGCTPAAPTPTPTRTPAATHSPVFSSDADALKAATDAYAAYLKMSDTIAHDGGKDPERFQKVAAGKALHDALAGVAAYAAKSVHTAGSTEFDSVKLQSVSNLSPASVSIYVCDDVAKIDVLDASGHSFVKPDRKPRTPWVVTVGMTADGVPVIQNRILWQGQDFC